MSVICWTVIHHAAAAARGTGHVLTHVIGRAVHRAHHAIPRPSHSWVEVVCKVVPAAVASGGVLAPTPANSPAPLPQPQPVFVEPLPGAAGWYVPSAAPLPYVPSATIVASAPEPGSALVLLGGIAGLLVIRYRAAASQSRTRRNCPGADQSCEPSPE